MRYLALFATLLATAGIADAAAPIEVEAAPTAVVPIGDLNLASDRGQGILKHRIAAAIEQVCGSYATVFEWSDVERIDMCRASASKSATQQLAERSLSIRLAAVTQR